MLDLQVCLKGPDLSSCLQVAQGNPAGCSLFYLHGHFWKQFSVVLDQLFSAWPLICLTEMGFKQCLIEIK